MLHRSNNLSFLLEFKNLWLLPAEVLVGEVAVLGCLEVDGLCEVKLLDYDTRAQIEILVDDLDQLVRRVLRCTVAVYEDREGLCDANCIGKLDQGTTTELGVDERFSDPSSQVCC